MYSLLFFAEIILPFERTPYFIFKGKYILPHSLKDGKKSSFNVLYSRACTTNIVGRFLYHAIFVRQDCGIISTSAYASAWIDNSEKAMCHLEYKKSTSVACSYWWLAFFHGHWLWIFLTKNKEREKASSLIVSSRFSLREISYDKKGLIYAVWVLKSGFRDYCKWFCHCSRTIRYYGFVLTRNQLLTADRSKYVLITDTRFVLRLFLPIRIVNIYW